MKNSVKKVLSMVLAVVMVVSLLPVSAFAAGGTSSGQTLPGLKAQSDSENVTVEKGKSVTITSPTMYYSSSRKPSIACKDNNVASCDITDPTSTGSGKTATIKFTGNSVGTGTYTLTYYTSNYSSSKTTYTYNVDVVPDKSVALSEHEVTLDAAKSGTMQLSATVVPENAEIVWSSSAEDVATVSDGLVKAVGKGTAVITAAQKSDNSIMDTCNVTVKLDPTGLELDKSSVNLKINDSETVTATIVPDGTGEAVIWSTSDSSVATVDKNGKILARGAGTATITATVSNTDISETVSVTVANRYVDDELTATMVYWDSNSNQYVTIEEYTISTGRIAAPETPSKEGFAAYTFERAASGDKYSTVESVLKDTEGKYWLKAGDGQLGENPFDPNTDKLYLIYKAPGQSFKITYKVLVNGTESSDSASLLAAVVSGPAEVKKGEDAIFVVTVPNGYTLEKVEDGNGQQITSKTSSYTKSNISANTTIRVRLQMTTNYSFVEKG